MFKALAQTAAFIVVLLCLISDAKAEGTAFALMDEVYPFTPPQQLLEEIDGLLEEQEDVCIAVMPVYRNTDYQNAVRIAPYAVDAVRWAVANGVLSGTSAAKIGPEARANRSPLSCCLVVLFDSKASSWTGSTPPVYPDRPGAAATTTKEPFSR